VLQTALGEATLQQLLDLCLGRLGTPEGPAHALAVLHALVHTRRPPTPADSAHCASLLATSAAVVAALAAHGPTSRTALARLATGPFANHSIALRYPPALPVHMLPLLRVLIKGRGCVLHSVRAQVAAAVGPAHPPTTVQAGPRGHRR
jgi:hypothetical protein